MLHSERHGIRQVFFKGVRRHAFQAVGVHPIHELLKSQHRNTGTRSLQRFRRHFAREQPPDDGGNNAAGDEKYYRIEYLFVTGELRDEKRRNNHQGRAHAVTVGRIRIEQVHAFVLQRRLDVLLYDRNRGVEAVFQAGQPGLLPARENILQHHALVGRQPLPFGHAA